ncbi:MAG: DUF3416 domain-containing protein, partial [Caulobacteraceae bacterium]|nr:DUF3416 domain-containing protein [Caulobacteraceae bacterium]
MASKNKAAFAASGWRAYAVSVREGHSEVERRADLARKLGFNVLLALGADAADPALSDLGIETALQAFAAAARRSGLSASAALVLDRVSADHPLACEISPGAYWPQAADLPLIDPRKPIARASSDLMLRRPQAAEVIGWWRAQLERLAGLGFASFAQIDAASPGVRLGRASTEGGVRNLRRSRSAAPGAGPLLVEADGLDEATLQARLAEGVLAGAEWAFADAEGLAPTEALRSVNRLIHCDRSGGAIRDWTGSGGAFQLLSRAAPTGGVVLVRNRQSRPLAWPPADWPPLPWRSFAPVAGFEAPGSALAPDETLLLEASALTPAKPRPADPAPPLDPALRVIISSVTPSVDAGAYAIKRVIGERIEVKADIFADGHEKLAAAVLARAVDEVGWTRHPMTAEPNDVWTAQLSFDRLGPHEFVVEAWFDVWGGFVRDLEKKRQAGLDLALEVREGRALIEAALARASAPAAPELTRAAKALAKPKAADTVGLLLSAPLAAAMAAADAQPFLAHSFVQPVEVEREAARFSSWYEIFPRSQTPDATRHGTFADVVKRLPRIAAMGFDTLYFPPIHPIGTKNRKGRNNSLTAQPGDVGSPYAIGSPDGGHDALHPELGSLDDFRALVAAAKAQGLEIALDFAIQCSPDHPWLREHPDWFVWRADGSMKYAENPPKKYEDIVNLDFYGEADASALWRALRDVVLFWLGEGVKTFRVDNPHTKPLPFWRWLIAEVKAADPEAIFLSEAFTRPKPMYHLAKV